ncbi:MAG: tryptophan--tRNA ligase [Acidimicrobiales bacterium]
MARVFSGIQPTGPVTLGNYLGALRGWVDDQHRGDSLFCVVDLHALTVAPDPTRLRALTLEQARLLLAAGLDPAVCTVFVQSHVAEHTELAWLLECNAGFGELRRMTQFKDKSAGADFVSCGLLTYPVLMAADILLYDVDRVPVGDDQRQHVELCRDIAIRFNSRFGPVFTVPEASVATVAARVMDLADPTRKMSASSGSEAGTVFLLDPPEVITRKLKRAVTDTGAEVAFDPATKPGVSNLLAILGAATNRTPVQAAAGYSQYGPLKADTAEAVVELLRPVQARYAELAADPAATAAILAQGAATASALAAPTLARAKTAVGLLPRT